MLILTLLLCLGSIQGKTIVQRLNYGVVFKENGNLVLSNEHWLHTFEITIPDAVPIPSIGTCQKDDSTCMMTAHILASLNTVRAETSARLNNTIETIRKLIPEAEVKRSRSRRSLLPFLGDLSKTLFGTATIEDVNTLARHINALTKRSRTMATLLAQHEDGLSSYITKANKRMDSLMQGIKENYIAINYIQTRFQETTSTLEDHIQTMILLLSQQVQTSSHINHELDEFKIGVADLVNGKLSPLLLPQEALSSTIKDIQEILNSKFPGFHLNQASPTDIYSDSNYLYSRNGTKLYITIKLPISHFTDPLHVFKVISLPVPLNSTSKHATHLLGMPDNLILTSNQQFYTTVSDIQLNSCKGKKVKQCSFNLALTPVTTESCVLALYINSKDKVKSLCDFRFVQNALKSEIIELKPNFLILYHTPLLSMECENEHKMIKGCDFCIVNLPCQCTILTTEFYLVPRIGSCHNHTKEITMMHPVNLILLQHFFSNSHVENMVADTSFQNPVNINVPHFNMYKHKMNDILANDKKSHLSIRKMAESARQNKTIYQSLAEPLLDGDIKINSNWPDKNAFIIFGLSGITATSIVISVLTCIKVKSLAQTVLLMQQVKPIKAFPTTIPSFNYKHDVAVINQETNFLNALAVTWEHGIFILALVTLALVILLIYFRKYKRNEPTLCLEVTNTQKCLLIDIARLPLCPSHCKIDAPTAITDVDIQGSWYARKLNIHWDGCKITNSMTQRVIEVPQLQNISYLTAKQVASIIRRPFFVYLHLRHNNVLTPYHHSNTA